MSSSSLDSLRIAFASSLTTPVTPALGTRRLSICVMFLQPCWSLSSPLLPHHSQASIVISFVSPVQYIARIESFMNRPISTWLSRFCWSFASFLSSLLSNLRKHDRQGHTIHLTQGEINILIIVIIGIIRAVCLTLYVSIISVVIVIAWVSVIATWLYRTLILSCDPHDY